jgi:glucose dehydrogenase
LISLSFRRVGVGILASVLVASTISATVSQRSAVATLAAGKGANVDWALLGNSYDNTRYSTLDQINTSNVKSLGLAWSQQEGPNLSGWETDPIVVDGVMYYTTAVDQVRAVNAATGKLLWQYTPKVNFYQAIAGGGKLI